MKLIWIIIGIIIAVAIFVLYPPIWEKIVSGFNWVLQALFNMFKTITNNTSNFTG